MKISIVILIVCSGFFFSFTEKKKQIPENIEVYGIWRGAYGVNDEIRNATVMVRTNNIIEFYDGEMKEANKTSGTYKIHGDTAIILTYFKPDNKCVSMYGNLNKTKNFVDGFWQTNAEVKGSFYLQKQSL